MGRTAWSLPSIIIVVLLVAACGPAPVAPAISAEPTATIDPAPPVDMSITLPPTLSLENSAGAPVTLLRLPGEPPFSREEAMRVVATRFPWGLGGAWEGTPVTVHAWYGLGTIGQRGPTGGWSGSVNIPLDTGDTLDHIEDRPLWLLDYGNVPGIIGSGCPGCLPPPVYNHNVYAIDAATRSLLWTASYADP